MLVYGDLEVYEPSKITGHNRKYSYKNDLVVNDINSLAVGNALLDKV